MKRFAKILMASLLALALTAASVPALVAYARDDVIEGRGVIGVDDTISSSSQVSTSSVRPSTSSSRPTTTSGAVTTTSRSTTTSTGGDTTTSTGTTTSRHTTTTSSVGPDVIPPPSQGGGGGGTTPVNTTSYTPVRVTTTSQAAGGLAVDGGGGTSSATAVSRSGSRSSASLVSSLPEEEFQEVEIPVDEVPANPSMEIFGYDVALGGPRQVGGWSLFSLLMVVLSVIAGLFFAIRNKVKALGSKAIYFVSGLAVVPVLLFFILQDFHQMYVFNHLSAMFGILFIVHLIVLLAVSFRSAKQVEEEK